MAEQENPPQPEENLNETGLSNTEATGSSASAPQEEALIYQWFYFSLN